MQPSWLRPSWHCPRLEVYFPRYVELELELEREHSSSSDGTSMLTREVLTSTERVGVDVPPESPPSPAASAPITKRASVGGSDVGGVSMTTRALATAPSSSSMMIGNGCSGVAAEPSALSSTTNSGTSRASIAGSTPRSTSWRRGGGRRLQVSVTTKTTMTSRSKNAKRNAPRKTLERPPFLFSCGACGAPVVLELLRWRSSQARPVYPSLQTQCPYC
eukprot:Amastigsp_a180648_9.p3 type:complete len:218 gc:universal Amastigsp_a180648_9:1592-939(-)